MCCLFLLYRKILPIQYMEKSFILCITEKVLGVKKDTKIFYKKIEKTLAICTKPMYTTTCCGMIAMKREVAA